MQPMKVPERIRKSNIRKAVYYFSQSIIIFN